MKEHGERFVATSHIEWNVWPVVVAARVKPGKVGKVVHNTALAP